MFFLKIIKNESGQSVLEVIIAMAFFALISASLVSLILGGFSLLMASGRIAQADFLAQEELEAVRAVKKRAWNELDFSTSSMTVADGSWEFAGEGSVEQIGFFSRTLSFAPVYRLADGSLSAADVIGSRLDPQSRMAKALVEWDGGIRGLVRMERETIFTNWERKEWVQSDWAGGGGQQIWQITDKFDFDDGNIANSAIGLVSLAEIATSTFASLGHLISSAYSIEQGGSFISIGWQADIPPECWACEVKFQIQTAPDIGGAPGIWNKEWIGPEGVDGDEDDFFTEPAWNQIHLSTNGRPWIRYKMIMAGEPAYTPILDSVRIDYQE